MDLRVIYPECMIKSSKNKGGTIYGEISSTYYLQGERSPVFILVRNLCKTYPEEINNAETGLLEL